MKEMEEIETRRKAINERLKELQEKERSSDRVSPSIEEDSGSKVSFFYQYLYPYIHPSIYLSIYLSI
jgi:hypothetical protein